MSLSQVSHCPSRSGLEPVQCRPDLGTELVSPIEIRDLGLVVNRRLKCIDLVRHALDHEAVPTLETEIELALELSSPIRLT